MIISGPSILWTSFWLYWRKKNVDDDKGNDDVRLEEEEVAAAAVAMALFVNTSTKSW